MTEDESMASKTLPRVEYDRIRAVVESATYYINNNDSSGYLSLAAAVRALAKHEPAGPTLPDCPECRKTIAGCEHCERRRVWVDDEVKDPELEVIRLRAYLAKIAQDYYHDRHAIWAAEALASKDARL